ncbi:hypothetical protein SAMN02982929_06823 [Saccharopolyspora kobensis]|uniref:Uncharacterized protein n=1 Tax=Saccharopolyspora kobensis TaxID=146035 RepID=A0A1H6EIF4_9PSEU|nr:hypothetical protein SAMN02982929_06823 [Saccharopolyspora kobensis]SFE93425.1 hypothetical protein SAMN05216506_11640 [Saccharopolyspora kobensis]
MSHLSSVPTQAPRNRAPGERDATQPRGTAKRAINSQRNHHCESRRGGAAA